VLHLQQGIIPLQDVFEHVARRSGHPALIEFGDLRHSALLSRNIGTLPVGGLEFKPKGNLLRDGGDGPNEIERESDNLKQRRGTVKKKRHKYLLWILVVGFLIVGSIVGFIWHRTKTPLRGADVPVMIPKADPQLRTLSIQEIVALHKKPFHTAATFLSTGEDAQLFTQCIPYDDDEVFGTYKPGLYNLGEKIPSAQKVVERRLANCWGRAFVIAAVLRDNGYPPYVLCVTGVDVDSHAAFVYRTPRGFHCLGSIVVMHDGIATIDDLILAMEEEIGHVGYYTHYVITNLDDEKCWRKGAWIWEDKPDFDVQVSIPYYLYRVKRKDGR
jgi:hypothetical protein